MCIRLMVRIKLEIDIEMEMELEIKRNVTFNGVNYFGD